ncbi:MAG: metallophosphoesterase, partial [Saprospiraceae bacterium]|nr:metallophosphoesterase [Saprospiraceae bacterium]
MNPIMSRAAGSIILVLILTACATYKTKMAVQYQNPAEINEKSNANLVHSVYLIGDAGGSHLGKTAPTLLALKRQLDQVGDAGSVIFLGDNIYPEGLPKKRSPDRQAAEWALKVQLDAVKDHSGKVVLTPGNHDWRLGLDGVRRQEKYVEDYLDRKNVFLPEKGCAGPVTVELTDNLILAVIDSEWWLQDWDKEPRINADCPVTTREELIRDYVDVLNKNRNKDIIVAFHHPLVTYGSHGGYFHFKDHIFPLSNSIKGLYLPLPILGSIYPLLRSAAGVRQDNSYKPFQDFRNQILARSAEHENLIFVGGHEHNLQLIEEENQTHIVSGSGSKSTPLYNGKNLIFGSTGLGFTTLDSYDDGSIHVRFFEVDETGKDQMVFTKEVKGPRESETSFDYSEYESGESQVNRSIYDPSETTKSGFYRFFWGDWYRHVYGQSLQVPKLDLSTTHGGLKPIRRGGGMQTNSLRLGTADGRQYVVRGMEKDAQRTLPSVLKNTFVVDMMRDLFTTAHPYAAFIIPEMAKAVGIYHTNPKLYYLPKQPALGQYNASFGDGLYLFEERPAND